MSDSPPSNQISGRSAFVELLKAEGVTQIFGNPGTTELPIMHALTDHPEMGYVLGLQESIRNLGWTDFALAPLVHRETAIYGLVVAGIWQGSGVTMAIMLAGLRGVDQEVWKAAKIDGIPTWRTYLFIVIPMMRGALGTVLLLQLTGIVRTFDLVYAAGPYDHLNRWVATRLTEALFKTMRPGGLLLVTNFVHGIRDVGYLEAFMDWHLNYRNAADMFALSSTLPEGEVADRRTFAEESGGIVFLAVRRR